MAAINKLKFVPAFLFLAGVAVIAADAYAQNQQPSATRISVPGNRTWTPTGIEVENGDRLVIEESNEAGPEASAISVRTGGFIGQRRTRFTARGSFLVKTKERGFPLPCFLDDARFPAYCLIGRIGEGGEPFYVGPHFDRTVDASGQLWLGVNDPDPRRNRGQIHCSVSIRESRQALPSRERSVVGGGGEPRPIPNANVVIFFIDGMRPDVILEMAAMGHLPTIRRLFIEGGAQVENAFTLLPSLTMTSTASILTGCFSDKHGVKTQFHYDRKRGRYIDELTKFAYARVAADIRRRGVTSLYDYFPDSFGAGALPIQPRTPKVLHANLIEWSHRAVNETNYVSRLKTEMDRAQGRFGVDLASFPDTRVMLFWLPGTDVDSEKHPQSQFGAPRRYIAGADRQIERIVSQLKRRGRFDNTYFILISDHGTAGGGEYVNQKFDVEREILHPHFALNTRSFYGSMPFPGTPAKHFASVWDTDGAVQVSLPYGRADSRDHSRPNLLAQLQDYVLLDGRRLNALEVLAEFTSQGRWTGGDPFRKPVDFAVARVDSDICFVHRTTKSQALIERRRRGDGQLEFKYTPVRNHKAGGPIDAIETGDPLGYLDSKPFREAVAREGVGIADWIGQFHTGREWMRVTAETDYPGNVDAISRFLHYDEQLSKPGQEDSLPDVALFAGRGWAFIPELITKSRGQEIAGGRHGMAFRESMRTCAFFSGPNIRQKVVIKEPQRNVDILPTVMTMMSMDWKGHNLDGIPVTAIWE